MSGDIADGAQRGSVNLARPFCDIVCHSENLLRLFVQEQMVVTKVMPAHVPMEVLRLQIKGEYIGQQLAECIRNLHYAVVAEIG